MQALANLNGARMPLSEAKVPALDRGFLYGGAVLTAPNSNAILPGITRSLLLRLATDAGVPVREQLLKRADLGRVGELFLTGTTSEVLPIVRVDGWPVGEGRPGPVTRRLQEAYARAVRDFVAGKPEPYGDGGWAAAPLDGEKEV